MPERFGDLVAMFMSALAVGYVVYEIERRRRKMYDIWNVLDEEDALLTAELEEWSRGVSFSPSPERRWLDCVGVLRRSEASREPSRSPTDRVFGPGGEVLARRFARRVLFFNEAHSLALDPARARATLNYQLAATGDPGIFLIRLADAVAAPAADANETELPHWPDGEPVTLYRHSNVVSIFAELNIGNGHLTARHPAMGRNHAIARRVENALRAAPGVIQATITGELRVRFDPKAVAALQLIRMAEAEILGARDPTPCPLAGAGEFRAGECHGRRCRGGRVRPATSGTGRLRPARPRQPRDLWRRRFSASRAQDWPPVALHLRCRHEALQRPVSSGLLDILVFSLLGIPLSTGCGGREPRLDRRDRNPFPTGARADCRRSRASRPEGGTRGRAAGSGTHRRARPSRW